MANATDNERIKLLATYYNNISVGLTVTVVFIPLLSVFNNFAALLDRLDSITSAVMNIPNDKGVSFLRAILSNGIPLTGLILGLYGAGKLREAADQEIQKITDAPPALTGTDTAT
jgi:hypothetical protein